MKKLLMLLIIIIMATIACNGQPNTFTTIQVGLVDVQLEKNYKLFMELKQDSLSGSRLVHGMDYLDPNVNDLYTEFGDPYIDGDTTFYDIVINDTTYKRFGLFGLIQIDNMTNKYSGMTVYPFWQDLDMIEPQQAGFFVRKKR